MSQYFLVSNAVTDAGSTLYASSEDSAHPLAWLRDQAPGKPWRSRPGWTFVTDFNNTGRYNRGGLDYDFTITAGYYSTPDAVCAAVVAALEAVDPTPAWASSYDAVTHKYTISSDIAFTPEFTPNGITMCWLDLGYSVSSAGTSATSHTGTAANYQSRQYVAIESSVTTFEGYLIAWAHAQGTGGAFYAGTGATLAAAIANAHASAVVATGGASHRILPIGYEPFVVWVISHGASTQGYCEIGNVYFGPYVTPTYSWTFTGYAREPQDLSGVEPAVSGAHVRTSRPVRNVWSVDWDALSETDMDVLRAIKTACPRGKNLWILFDPDDLTDVAYVTLDSGPNERLMSPTLYGPAATFAQVLP